MRVSMEASLAFFLVCLISTILSAIFNYKGSENPWKRRFAIVSPIATIISLLLSFGVVVPRLLPPEPPTTTTVPTVTNIGTSSPIISTTSPINHDGIYYFDYAAINGVREYLDYGPPPSITLVNGTFENTHNEYGKIVYEAGETYILYEKVAQGDDPSFPLRAKILFLNSKEVKITYINLGEINLRFFGKEYYEVWRKRN
ncbi:MAG: hypothetical protein LBN05_00820 [Oscillospiraceae bacterium]|jgi:hypothetical protein|nr:hypothetical protein [Oscillospiraceae bacterium]